LISAWKAVEESCRGRLVVKTVGLALPARKAVHSPNWAWMLAGPVAGMVEEVLRTESEVMTLDVEWVEWDAARWAAAVARPTAAWVEACGVV
jgi:hypothetical protein